MTPLSEERKADLEAMVSDILIVMRYTLERERNGSIMTEHRHANARMLSACASALSVTDWMLRSEVSCGSESTS